MVIEETWHISKEDKGYFDPKVSVIYIREEDVKILLAKYSSVPPKRIINNIIYWGKKFNENPFEEASRTVFFEGIKDYVTFYNSKYLQQQIVNEFGDSDEFNKRIKQIESEKELDRSKEVLGQVYEEIIEILKEYSDLKPEYYGLVSLWILGTYLHDSFETYPYLFINAMRGSGKTRLLKLIAALARNGQIVTSLKEAVLFRTAKGRTLCIDEFESIASKENQALRELINACYKKGMKVERMKQQKTLTGIEFVVESFEPYTPLCMANIWGMEEVLGDRCITLILEKSSNDYFNLIMEDFGSKLEIKNVTTLIKGITTLNHTGKCSLCSYFDEKGYVYKWNNWVKNRYNYISTFTTYTTLTTLTTLQEDQLFNKIHETGIRGRNLELFFPLFLMADFLGDNVLDSISKVAENITKERREEEMTESKDVSFIDFISQYNKLTAVQVKVLTKEFKEFLQLDDEEDRWINTRWVGKALTRLNLIKEKRRLAKGIEIIPNIEKAKEKMKFFRK